MLGIHYWAFVLPIVTAAVWLVDIVGLLVLWSRDGFPQYKQSDASIVFISDVGANHTTWFIIFSVLTGCFYIATAFAERYLRSSRRIPGSVKKRQTIYDILSVIFACLGSLFLGLLSGFNDEDYSTVHWSCTLLFIVCVGISVFFQILELFSLSHWHNPQVRHLKINAIFKAFLLIFAVVVLLCFVGLYADCQGDAPGYNTSTKCNKVTSAAGVFEWACAFILFFFFLSYIVDLWPRNYYGKQQAMAEKRASKHGGIDPEMASVGGTGSSANVGAGHEQYQSNGDYSVEPYVNAPQDSYGTVNGVPQSNGYHNGAADAGGNYNYNGGGGYAAHNGTMGRDSTGAAPSLQQPPLAEHNYNGGYR
ncbi:hypothetical protein BCV69DRAFT_283903 [Microstroma glucosiphilum]|uniref:CWH43-like N-terminal domain-containing protein n=1 Tax=Pseudomicrostroma glucosiphilum TaxID=1684307 RepID=A0A316U3C3_9BASI|nr:hypothetical protein BCV69DRAFT_283903 [Pseudomicrostroma glucosiphilum]PWN19802.1 hypothetical protein BCV69DRAFT_283903 [Pseudomicrostroma glucosiphilum]